MTAFVVYVIGKSGPANRTIANMAAGYPRAKASAYRSATIETILGNILRERPTTSSSHPSDNTPIGLNMLESPNEEMKDYVRRRSPSSTSYSRRIRADVRAPDAQLHADAHVRCRKSRHHRRIHASSPTPPSRSSGAKIGPCRPFVLGERDGQDRDFHKPEMLGY